jgi:hypothetical protein
MRAPPTWASIFFFFAAEKPSVAGENTGIWWERYLSFLNTAGCTRTYIIGGFILATSFLVLPVSLVFPCCSLKLPLFLKKIHDKHVFL